MKDEHLVPELVKNIGEAALKKTGNEKFMAEARIRTIAEYCQKVLEQSSKIRFAK